MATIVRVDTSQVELSKITSAFTGVSSIISVLFLPNIECKMTSIVVFEVLIVHLVDAPRP